MKNISILMFALILIVIVFMPLLEAIQSGFESTNGYYGEHLVK